MSRLNWIRPRKQTSRILPLSLSQSLLLCFSFSFSFHLVHNPWRASAHGPATWRARPSSRRVCVSCLSAQPDGNSSFFFLFLIAPSFSCCSLLQTSLCCGNSSQVGCFLLMASSSSLTITQNSKVHPVKLTRKSFFWFVHENWIKYFEKFFRTEMYWKILNKNWKKCKLKLKFE